MFEFRAAKEADFEAICALVKSGEELFLFYPNGTYPFTVAQLKTLSDVRMELTVVVDSGEIIGFANLYNYLPKKYAFIGNVVVDPRQRGKGIGKSLVHYMLDKAFEKYELPELRLSVFSENTRALLLYTSFGFIPYDIEDRVNPQGTRVALIHLKKSAI